MIISLKSLYKSYGEREVLKGVDLQIKRGESISIEGPSGSGKSTLLNICGALDKGDRGEVFVDGIDLNSLSRDQLADLRNRSLGFVFQEHLLLPQFSLLENVLIPSIPLGIDSREYALELLEFMGLKDRLNSSINELSTGESQRVAIARALINKPAILLADEPTGALDRENSENLVKLLNGVNREMGITVVCVTHSLYFAESMNKRYRLVDGKLKETNN